MNGFLKFLGIALVAALVSYGVSQRTEPAAVKETAFERVMRTNTLRCGYYVYPPITYRNVNTGELSGLSVDMMNAIASKAGLKIEWVEEVSFGNWVVALEAGRYDVACTPMWPSINIGRVALFGKPFIYSNIHIIGRADDNRFNNLDDVNKTEVKVSIFEGNDMHFLTRESLPNATLVEVPGTADGTQPILDILSGKADVMISDGNAPAQWNPKNDRKIAIVAGGVALKTQFFSLVVRAGENDLNNFLNNAVDDLIATRSIDRLVGKWMEHKAVYSVPTIPLSNR